MYRMMDLMDTSCRYIYVPQWNTAVVKPIYKNGYYQISRTIKKLVHKIHATR